MPPSASASRPVSRRVESLGYASLISPDGPALMSPWATLAVAATATTSLHVGTFVLASPLRHPRLAAWDAHTLSVMTGGRFEMGIGTGRPEVTRESVELFGMPPSTPAQRLAQVEQVTAALAAARLNDDSAIEVIQRLTHAIVPLVPCPRRPAPACASGRPS